MKPERVALSTAGALALLGLVVWLSQPSGGSDAPPPAPVAAKDASELAALAKSVGRLEEALAVARTQLAEEIAQLRGELHRHVAEAEIPVSAGPKRPSEAPPEQPDRSRGRLDEDALIKGGFAPRDVAALRSRIDSLALERLYLRDRATREGWLETRRYRQESRALADQLFTIREEFSDAMYDWAMYSTGHPNRVRVVEIMEGSAAADAGLSPGDVILAYDERRIFGLEELRDQTTAGVAGETTPVDLVRDGESVRAYLPRGPLGVILEPFSVEPPPLR